MPLYEPVDRRRLAHGTGDQARPYSASLRRGRAHTSIEYGAAVLGTSVFMVLGHGNCGAVKAAIAAEAVPGQISSLYSYLRPAVNQANGNLDAAIAGNARIQTQVLRESSTVVAGLVQDGKIKVVAAFYDLASGKVNLLD